MTSSSDRPEINGVPLERRKADRRVNPGTGNPYARFIPREEMPAFAAWAPNAFGTPTTNPLTGEQTPAQAQPSTGTSAKGATAAAPAAAVPDTEEARTQQRVREAHDRGYQDGYRDGLAALEAFKQQYAAQSSAQVGALVNALQQQFMQLEATLARRIADVAVALSAQVVRTEIRQRPDVVVAVAQEALGTLLSTARQVTVRAHPSDLPILQAGAGDLLAAREARLVADEQITPGGCLVESDLAVVDARVPTCWSRAVASVGVAAHELPALEEGTP